MRHLAITIFLILPALIFGQKNNRLSFAVQLQPEYTYHKNNYAYRWRDTYTKPTFNIGLEATLQYYLANRLFIESGIGYISRKLNTIVFLNQGALPPPRQSSTMELVNTESVSFRTLQLPLNIGYNIITKRKININLDAGFTGNFLLNTYYGLGGFTQYQGAYKKNYWQGYSVNAGLGADYTLSKKISATGRITYSILNTVKSDEYLFSQDEYVIPLPHTYARISLGLRTTL